MKKSDVKLNIENVLMDVDGTMTEVKENKSTIHSSPLELLIDLLVEKRSVSREAALKLIHETDDITVTCLFDFLDKLEVSKESYWKLIKNDLENIINIPEDTVYFITDLKIKGIKLFSATTNSQMMTLLKLAIGGLATINGSPYMTGFFSGNFFNDPEGKFSKNFFPSIMKYGKFDPATTMMIGDEIERDLNPALKAGIKNAVIINRKQKEKLIYKNNGIYVNSLKILCNMV